MGDPRVGHFPLGVTLECVGDRTAISEKRAQARAGFRMIRL